MRAETTQSLSDGELFSIIEHGIRLTGMPGWGNGTPEGERESWELVHFVRRLPTLTDEDIERMGALNPKSPAERKEDEDARRFLAGDTKLSWGRRKTASNRHPWNRTSFQFAADPAKACLDERSSRASPEVPLRAWACGVRRRLRKATPRLVGVICQVRSSTCRLATRR